MILEYNLFNYKIICILEARRKIKRSISFIKKYIIIFLISCHCI